MKTYSVKQGDVKRETHVIDASDKILGALLLRSLVYSWENIKPCSAPCRCRRLCHSNKRQQGSGNWKETSAETLLLAFQLPRRF
jgi:hypothetical protein